MNSLKQLAESLYVPRRNSFRIGRHSRNTKQRNPTKIQRVGSHCSCPLPQKLVSHWSAPRGLPRPLAGSAVRTVHRRPVFRCVGIRGRKIKWNKSSDRRKVHAGVSKYLRGAYEGKKTYKIRVCVGGVKMETVMFYRVYTFRSKEKKEKKK